MRKTWLTSLIATLCAVGMAGSHASGNPPVYMAARPRATTPQAPLTAPLQAEATAVAGAPRPSSLISPAKHPIKYFKAAMTELPRPSMPSMPSVFKWGSDDKEMEPARPANDSISLSTPVGLPTPQLLISTAQLCERQGDVERARHQFQQALALWPGDVEVLRAAARMEDRQANLPLAENLYRQAVASNPNHAGALNDLGLCLARQGKMDQSVQAIEQAIQLQPDKPLFRNNAATVLVEMRQDQRALGHLAAVHSAADANYNLGQLLAQRGRSAEAVPYFQTALQLNPQMQPAQIALANMQPNMQPSAVGNTAQYAPAPTAQQPAPSVAPAMGPPAAPQMAPQVGYPATARAPEVNSAQQFPRYLPPVAAQPGMMQR